MQDPSTVRQVGANVSIVDQQKKKCTEVVVDTVHNATGKTKNVDGRMKGNPGSSGSAGKKCWSVGCGGPEIVGLAILCLYQWEKCLAFQTTNYDHN